MEKEVLILTNTLFSGGAEKQSVLLAKNLAKYFPTTLVVYYGDKIDPKLRDIVLNNKINVTYLKGNHVKKIIQLLRRINRGNVTIMISYLATTNLLNAILGYFTGVKYRIGGIRSSRLGSVKMYIQRFLHNKLFTHTICNNYEALDFIKRYGFDLSKASVIHNCIELSEPVRYNVEKKNTITILTVGRFVPAKDLKTALTAFSLLIQSIKEQSIIVRFEIVGYGEQEDYLRELIKRLSLDEIVSVVINPLNIRDYYQNADIYLSTSLFEGLSNSIMEAMEFSLPVVATNVGDNRYLVIDGETGFLVPTQDPDSIATALETLINSAELRKDFGVKGYKQLVENFSEEKFIVKYLELINTLGNDK